MADDPNEDTWLYGANPEPPNSDETDAKPTVADDPMGDTPADVKVPTDIGSSSNKDDVNGNLKEENAASNENDDDDDGAEAKPEVGGAEKSDGEKNAAKEGDANGNESEIDSDEEDDDINVVIGDITTGSTYNIKQRAVLATGGAPGAVPEKKQAPGKFSIDEFECVGTISGVPAHEFSIDSLDEKPWRKPGADITDYFNYGFNEDTWRAYCERQKQMRLNESGVGLQGLSAGLSGGPNQNAANRTLTPLTSNDSNAFASNSFNMGGLIRRAGPPPGRKVTGQIDVIGSNGLNSRRELDGSLKPVIPCKENVIQVMTAERREYSRVQGKFDSSMPPPPFAVAPEPFFEAEGYNYGYEPTQEQQWNNDQPPGWMPTGIKELTPGHMGPMSVQSHQMGMRPPMGVPQMVPPPQMVPSPHMGGGHKMMPPPSSMDRDRDHRERDRERSERSDRSDRGDRDREYPERSRSDRVKSEDKDRDRFRERSTRRETSTRERSRSRERRRRSKSRDKDRKSRDKKKSHKKDKETKEERVSE